MEVGENRVLEHENLFFDLLLASQEPPHAPFLNGLFSRGFLRGKTAHAGIRGSGPLRAITITDFNYLGINSGVADTDFGSSVYHFSRDYDILFFFSKKV